MVEFRMRGSDLFDYSNHRVARVRGNEIFDSQDRLVATIHEDTILDEHNQKIASVRGKDVLDTSKKRIASVDEISRAIADSMGGVSIIALWLLFVRNPART